MKIYAVEGELEPVDVTEAVKALYDLAIAMNFGSGFWTAEDAEPVAWLARTCGFEEHEQIQRYIDREAYVASLQGRKDRWLNLG